METEIYFIRHGATIMNVNGLLQGNIDTQLSPNGIEQAKRAREFVEKNGLIFTKVISSPLSRAFNTAVIVSGFEEEKVDTDDRLKEIHFGEFEGAVVEELKQQDGEVIFSHPDRFESKEGESYYDVVERLSGFVKDIVNTYETTENEKILVASHGAAIRAIDMCFNKTEMKDFWKPRVNNCEIFKLKKDGEKYSLEVFFEGYHRVTDL